MARHHTSEERVQEVISKLVRLYLQHESVNAVQNILDDAASALGCDKSIYANRLHALLSADPSRAVNTATLETLEAAVGHVAVPDEGSIGAANGQGVQAEVLHAFEARRALYESREDSEGVVKEVAERLGKPQAVVQAILEDADHLDGDLPSTRQRGKQAQTNRKSPDWSFQDEAHQACLQSLRRDPNRKAGLVVPTGGGKTRIAMRVILTWLNRAERNDTVVLWITHRRRLRRQARRELQRVLNAGASDLPSNAAELFKSRICFVMRSKIASALDEHEGRIEFAVVDEGHHAAAPSYQPLFEAEPLRGLFLTATPNRVDSLPIGIDEIAYRTTYRELFERGVIVEPVFEELTIEDLDWSNERHVADLANYLIERTADDLKKVLVAVTRTERLDILYEALLDQLGMVSGHPLSEEDIGFVHGSGSSASATPDDFLDEFEARPRGILAATSQLVGEGYDDRSIDTVVVTYESSSIGHLMQVAGRALRWEESKDTAHVVQVHTSKVAYHFEQGWLYQDISDALRPQLENVGYASPSELRDTVVSVLDEHRVGTGARTRVMSRVEAVESGERCNLLLTGLPYYDEPEAFDECAEWGGVFIGADERSTFRRVFNHFSDHGGEIHRLGLFLENYLTPDTRPESKWKAYRDVLEAMNRARQELMREPYSSESFRNYTRRVGSSWLKYYTFEYRPDLPPELEEFLSDAVNRDEIAGAYLAGNREYELTLKVPFPLVGTQAFLLDDEEAKWFRNQRSQLIESLSKADPEEGFEVVERWRRSHSALPVHTLILKKINSLLRREDYQAMSLILK